MKKLKKYGVRALQVLLLAFTATMLWTISVSLYLAVCFFSGLYLGYSWNKFDAANKEDL